MWNVLKKVGRYKYLDAILNEYFEYDITAAVIFEAALGEPWVQNVNTS